MNASARIPALLDYEHMNIQANTPKFVSCGEYENYVPAKVSFTTKSKNWDGLLLTKYDHPRQSLGSPRPGTKDHILGYLSSGGQKGEYCYGNKSWKKFTSTEGDWIIQQAYENHDVDFRWEANFNDDRQLSSYLVHISPKLLEDSATQVCENGGKVELPHKINFQDPTLVKLVSALKIESDSGHPFGQMYVETVANFLSVHLLQNFCTQPYQPVKYKNRFSMARLHRVIDYIHAYLHENISLNDLAKVANMSTYHFARVFKRNTGRSPHHYLMQCRMERAKELLKNTDWPVTRIADATGYNNPGAFATMFKQLNDIGPTRYRKQI